MNEADELLEVINEDGEVVKLVSRSECHMNPNLIHRVVHVIIVDDLNRVYLQKRSLSKDIQPGKWDTSVGGHLCPGEPLEIGALREMEEELGITGIKLIHMYHYMMSNELETELVNSYKAIWNGPVYPNPHEIEVGRYWRHEEIQANLGKDIFTPNFEDEYKRYQVWQKKYS